MRSRELRLAPLRIGRETTTRATLGHGVRRSKSMNLYKVQPAWQTNRNLRFSIRIPQTSDFFNDPAFGPQIFGSERRNRLIDNKANKLESNLQGGQEEK